MDEAEEKRSAASGDARRRASRRGNVFSKSVAVDVDWKPVVVPKTPEQRAAILVIMRKNVLFNAIDDDQRSLIIDVMVLKEFNAGDTIIKQVRAHHCAAAVPKRSRVGHGGAWP